MRVGDILLTSSTENPAETYLGTTWELLPDNKFLKTGATPLQQAGNNSIKIAKENLPAEKLQIDSFSLTRGTMDITGNIGTIGTEGKIDGAFKVYSTSGLIANSGSSSDYQVNFTASRTWTGSTSSASPYTTTMGNGTPITISPEHITVRAWKRLS